MTWVLCCARTRRESARIDILKNGLIAPYQIGFRVTPPYGSAGLF